MTEKLDKEFVQKCDILTQFYTHEIYKACAEANPKLTRIAALNKYIAVVISGMDVELLQFLQMMERDGVSKEGRKVFFVALRKVLMSTIENSFDLVEAHNLNDYDEEKADAK